MRHQAERRGTGAEQREGNRAREDDSSTLMRRAYRRRSKTDIDGPGWRSIARDADGDFDAESRRALSAAPFNPEPVRVEADPKNAAAGDAPHQRSRARPRLVLPAEQHSRR
jgi:hypothetical protein